METLFVMLRNVRWPLLLVTLHAVGVYLLRKLGLFEGILLSEAFTSVGTSATAIVMIQSFRFRISYERWREADTLWRTIKIESMSFFILTSYHLGTQSGPKQRKEVLNQLKEYLLTFAKDLHDLTITHPRLAINSERSPSAPFRDEGLYQILHLNASQTLFDCFKHKILPVEQARYFNLHTGNLLLCAENLIRIRSTRTPRYFSNFSVFLIYFLSFVAPYLLVASLEAMMIPLVLINASIFLMLDQMSDRGEIPFGQRKSDVPSLQIIRDLEIQLNAHLEALDEPLKRNVA